MTLPAPSPLPNLTVQRIRWPGGDIDYVPREKITQDTEQLYYIPWECWRKHDDWAALGTAASDDLGMVAGTFGSASPSIQSGDLMAAGATTRYARCCLYLPPEYDPGQTAKLRLHAGMADNMADTSATIDAVMYEANKEAGISADLITTVAQDINSTTLADFDFDITSTGLLPGDLLDLRIAMAINDASSSGSVTGILGFSALLLDIRG